MMAFGRGEHEAPRVYLCSRRYRCGILAPPPHPRRRDGGIGAAADRGQRCGLAFAYLQELVKARKIAKARHLAKFSLSLSETESRWQLISNRGMLPPYARDL